MSANIRLDQYVIQEKPRLSRAYAVRLINEGAVLVNDKLEKPGFKVRPADQVKIDFDEALLDQIPDISLPIIYEDDDVIVIDKPAGVISHARGRYWNEASVASFIRDHGWKADDSDNSFRAGIVHRLDRATSGVMICAKNPAAMNWLQKQFSDRKVQKTYLALVAGNLKELQAVIQLPIERNPNKPQVFRVSANGKPAETDYSVVKRYVNNDLVELKPHTGRTHQLRVHMEYLGHPIIGDSLYGTECLALGRMFLHAASLEITLPSKELKRFEAPLPDDLQSHLNSLTNA